MSLLLLFNQPGPVHGTLSATIANAVLAGTGKAPASGSLSRTIAPVTITATGSSPARGQLAAMIAPILVAGGAILADRNFLLTLGVR